MVSSTITAEEVRAAVSQRRENAARSRGAREAAAPGCAGHAEGSAPLPAAQTAGETYQRDR